MSVESLSDRTRNGKLRSPEQCLQSCLDDIGKHGAFKEGKKLLVICLDDVNGGYNISWAQAGMRMHECVALTTIANQLFLNEMGYNAITHEDLL